MTERWFPGTKKNNEKKPQTRTPPPSKTTTEKIPKPKHQNQLTPNKIRQLWQGKSSRQHKQYFWKQMRLCLTRKALKRDKREMIPILDYIRKKNQTLFLAITLVLVVEVKDPGMKIKIVFLKLLPHYLGLE